MTKQKALFQSVLLATAVLKATEVKLKPTRHPPPQHGTVRNNLEKNHGPYFKRKDLSRKERAMHQGPGLSYTSMLCLLASVIYFKKDVLHLRVPFI